MTSWRRRAAIGRLVIWFLVLRVVKHGVPVPTLVRWLYCPSRGIPGDPHSAAACVIRAGAMIGAPDEDCLERSLLLYRELSAAGARPELVVGIRRLHGRLQGHAWVLLDGSVVCEPGFPAGVFTPIIRFGADGRLTAAATKPAG